jgi:hypothetical protein
MGSSIWRKALLYTVMLGDSALGAVSKFTDHAGGYWANKILGPRFITKYGTKQGVLVLSK